MTFEERMENAPHFAKDFVEKVEREFGSVNDASVNYTNCPDMRIRKHNDTKRGFSNAATITWQPRKKRFLIATALSEAEIKSSKFDIHERIDTLPSVVYLDETITSQEKDDILKYLKYAQKVHEPRGRR